MKQRSNLVKSVLKKGDCIHLIGIGGTGMVGIAHCLFQRKYQVSGSDLQLSNGLRKLQDQGIKIHIGHNEKNVPDNCSLVVKSAAIRGDNPEIVRARQLHIPILKYSQLLGFLMQEQEGIAVAGCHGKTTTSALIAYTLSVAKKNPSFVIGGFVTDLNASAKLGCGKHFVAEACEYDKSFHNLVYKIAVINNIEEDHLDYYKKLNNIISAFRIFAEKTPRDGVIVANIDNENVRKAIQGIKRNIVTFSLDSTNDLSLDGWVATDIKAKENKWQFTVLYKGKKYGDFSLGISGIHNIYNALAVLAVAHLLKINKADVKKAFSDFTGVVRRFQSIGWYNGAQVFDDYGHHPTEINAVLETAHIKFPDKHIWIVFQPHQASRTRLFLSEFAEVLAKADKVVISDIFFARDSELEKKKISSRDLVNLINQKDGNAIHIATLPDIIKYLKGKLTQDDIVITTGAGDVYKIAHQLVGIPH